MQNLSSQLLRRPNAKDDKYSRGVVGFVTGSEDFPGAAILGVTAAMRVGVGMVRYLGPDSVTKLVLEVRPEVVIQPGRAQAWVVGSGVPEDPTSEQAKRISRIASQPGLMVVDAGALALIDFSSALATCVLTPHAGEMASLLTRLGHNFSRAEVEAHAATACELAAKLTGQVVLLKGSKSIIAHGTESVITRTAPAALATAGTGDVLAGILGALLAANAEATLSGEIDLVEVCLLAIELHSRACEIAAKDGPVVALDVAEAVRLAVEEQLLANEQTHE
jgi:hydroxyethylthiazole kinase-like uncharacterized protein yjeF